MLEWIDGNIGSKVNMKYPCSILNGPHARTSVLSMAFANYGQHLDAGCKVYHNAPHTSSTLISKSVAKDGQLPKTVVRQTIVVLFILAKIVVAQNPTLNVIRFSWMIYQVQIQFHSMKFTIQMWLWNMKLKFPKYLRTSCTT